jgi:hypothetical protein
LVLVVGIERAGAVTGRKARWEAEGRSGSVRMSEGFRKTRDCAVDKIEMGMVIMIVLGEDM